MKKLLIAVVLVATTFTSCLNDLNTKPEVELTLEQLLAQDPDAISGILSRLYASYALSSIKGPGESDIDDNAGESPFLRGIINLQDFTADGMKNRWGDDGLDQLTTTSNWDENNKFFRYLYNRIYYTIPQANNLLAVLKNVTVNDQENIVSEVRFIRALAYYYLVDTFGKGVLATEDNIGSSSPLPQANRQELFNFVESELLAIEPKISDANGYGRANKAVVQMLLAKLYLNAEVYTGTPKYTEAGTFIKKVIDAGRYSLAANFVQNFSADNDQSTEIIFPLIADAVNSQSFGNTTYIVNGSLSADTMNLDDFGATSGWGGHRATSAWYGKFCGGVTDLAQLQSCTDVRSKLFWTQGHTFEMADYKKWTDGYPSVKFRNTKSTGSSTSTNFSSTDFPLFRLADAYLIYAECALRGATSADAATALGYVNQIRTRAKTSTINSSQLTLDFIIDERARELNLEGHRRTDLIRYGRFTGGSYLWPWKGNTANGTSIPANYKLFPVPFTALEANPNLTQNPGY